MKKLSLSLLAIFVIGSVSAAPKLRVDVSGLDLENKVKISKGQSRTMRYFEARWRPEADRPYSLMLSAISPLQGKDWKTCTFGIKTENTGPVMLAIGGEWAQAQDEREWVIVGGMKIGDETIDFGKIKKGDNGFSLPEGFALVKDAEVVDKDGIDGKPAILCNHDSRFQYTFKAEAGKSYEISITVKAEAAE